MMTKEEILKLSSVTRLKAWAKLVRKQVIKTHNKPLENELFVESLADCAERLWTFRDAQLYAMEEVFKNCYENHGDIGADRLIEWFCFSATSINKIQVILLHQHYSAIKETNK